MTPRPLLRLYAARLRRQVAAGPLPVHLGIVSDGNRRWARRSPARLGQRGSEHGARKAREVLGLVRGRRHLERHRLRVFGRQPRPPRCGRGRLPHAADRADRLAGAVRGRPPAGRCTGPGTVDLLPGSTARALKDAVESTRDSGTGRHLTLAVGYSGRQEIVEAVRAVLHDAGNRTPAELAATLTQADIDRRLDTAGRPDPELIIRTSGEQRLSDFLRWQGVRSELWFCDAYWPAFREIDFLRALRGYASRRSRPH